MKFLYADSIDTVSPKYDFLNDRQPTDRKIFWDDEFAHEHMDNAPYDGVLISRGIVGDHKISGKYSQSQSMRFRRDGARKFLRLDDPKFDDLMIFGDCGAFTYVNHEKPPYSPMEILDFYEDGGFSHGCSPDHVIFQFEQKLKGMEDLPDPDEARAVRDRFEITLENAVGFYNESVHVGQDFTPLGVIQGWSPGSMAESARRLVKMGYDYLAIGGMVPLSIDSICVGLDAIRGLIGPHPKLHILGYGKVDQLHRIADYNITSIDTTSPMLRAFKDTRNNFFMPGEGTGIRYYSAIRIPQATENRGIKTLIRKGHFTQEYALQSEANALRALRQYDRDQSGYGETIEAVMIYSRMHMIDPKSGEAPSEMKVEILQARYEEMLTEMPWKQCDCAVCRTASVEGAIFRASNRNKRRGMHNLHVFYEQLKKSRGKITFDEQEDKDLSNSGASK
jgi:hypothetical protein